MTSQWLQTTESGMHRCWWPGEDVQYVAYHDSEWGRPVQDDQRLFEKLCLEGFQAGLSWLTILRKRENFRQAFNNFDLEVVASFSDGDVERLLSDAGIVRHRGKIEATINNAARALELIETESSLSDFFWSFAPDTAFGRDEILKHVWGENYYGSDRVVDDLLRRLRHKMPDLKNLVAQYSPMLQFHR